MQTVCMVHIYQYNIIYPHIELPVSDRLQNFIRFNLIFILLENKTSRGSGAKIAECWLQRLQFANYCKLLQILGANMSMVLHICVWATYYLKFISYRYQIKWVYNFKLRLFYIMTIIILFYINIILY